MISDELISILVHGSKPEVFVNDTMNRLPLNRISSAAAPVAATTRRQLCRGFATTTNLNADFVRIVEVGPRDGLQNEKGTIPLSTKLELIRRLAQTGVTHLEAGSFVPAKWVPQVRRYTDFLAQPLLCPRMVLLLILSRWPVRMKYSNPSFRTHLRQHME